MYKMGCRILKMPAIERRANKHPPTAIHGIMTRVSASPRLPWPQKLLHYEILSAYQWPVTNAFNFLPNGENFTGESRQEDIYKVIATRKTICGNKPYFFFFFFNSSELILLG